MMCSDILDIDNSLIAIYVKLSYPSICGCSFYLWWSCA